MNINFNIAGKGLHVELQQTDKVDQANCFEIGGRSYVLQGSSEAIQFVKSCFDALPQDSKIELEQVGKELKSRMWLKGAQKIDVQGVHKLGMSIVGKNEQINIPAIINEISDKFEKFYVFPNIAEKCASYLREQLAQGAYDAISDGDAFAEAVTADLRLIAEDKHIDFWVNQEAAQEAAPAPSMPERYTIPDVIDLLDFKADTNIGLMGRSLNSIPYEMRTGYLDQKHKVGYIDFRVFGAISEDGTKAEVADSSARRQAIIAGVQNIRNADSIVIDLRNNGGGKPSTVQLLCSLFMEEGKPLNTLLFRGEEPRAFFTLSLDELPKEQRLTDSKLFVLIGPGTFSAAEEFSNNIKVHNKGKIVGEPSAGGANPGGTFPIGDGNKFEIKIPQGRAYNPLQGGNWEGVGIIPDHMVPAEQALAEAMRHITH